MRLLHVSDLHYHQPWFDWVIKVAPKYDVVCITGDFLEGVCRHVSTQQQSETVNRWLTRVHHPAFLVSGNHDSSLHQRPDLAGTRFLHCSNSKVRSDGANELFMGRRFVCAAWGQPLRNIRGTEPVVLLSHAPPADTRLAITDRGDFGELDVRCVAESLPKHSIVLSGHVHEPDAWCERVNNTWCFNPGAASLDSTIPNHIRLNLGQGLATFFGKAKNADDDVIVQSLW